MKDKSSETMASTGNNEQGFFGKASGWLGAKITQATNPSMTQIKSSVKGKQYTSVDNTNEGPSKDYIIESKVTMADRLFASDEECISTFRS